MSCQRPPARARAARLLEEDHLVAPQAEVGALLEEVTRGRIRGGARHDVPAQGAPAASHIWRHAYEHLETHATY